MSIKESSAVARGQYVRANGIDIHYLDLGEGRPLVLLHGGMVSTNPIWTGVPIAYASHMDTLAEHFRVIAPDTRGGGKTRHTGGPISFDLLADDVAALIDALRLERPLVAGFSEGGSPRRYWASGTPTRSGRSSTTPASTRSIPRTPG